MYGGSTGTSITRTLHVGLQGLRKVRMRLVN